MKKFAFCLALCLFCSTGLYPCFAAGNSRPFMGAGTAEDPYRISTAKGLLCLAEYVNEGNEEYNGAHYLLTADIDLDWERQIPIGTEEAPFKGTLDGGSHMISRMSVGSDEVYYCGLVGVLDGGTVKNLFVEGGIQGRNTSGGIVGWNKGGRVINCMSACDMGWGGGLVGKNSDGGFLANCCVTDDYEPYKVVMYGVDYRGIVMDNMEGGIIENCYTLVPHVSGVVSSGEHRKHIYQFEYESLYPEYENYNHRRYNAWFNTDGILHPVNCFFEYPSDTPSEIINGETTLLGALNAWVEAQESDEYRRWVQAPGRYPILEGQSIGKGDPSEWAEEPVARVEALGFVPGKLQNQYQGEITRQEFAEVALRFLVAQYNYYDMDGMDETAFLERFLSSEKGAKAAARTREELEGLLSPEQAAENDGSWGFLLRNAQTFSDVEGEARINGAYVLGIINGKGDGTFAPEAPITRQEAAAMLGRVYALYSGGGAPEEPGETMFTDGEQIAPWAEAAVAFMAENRVMEGTGNGAFSPEDGYTREQCYSTFLRLYENMEISRAKGNVEPFATMEEEVERVKCGAGCDASWECYENDEVVLVLAHYEGSPGEEDYNRFYICHKSGGVRVVAPPEVTNGRFFAVEQEEGDALVFKTMGEVFRLNLKTEVEEV